MTRQAPSRWRSRYSRVDDLVRLLDQVAQGVRRRPARSSGWTRSSKLSPGCSPARGRAPAGARGSRSARAVRSRMEIRSEAFWTRERKRSSLAAQSLLGLPAVGDVLERPLVAEDLGRRVAEGPQGEADPDDRAVRWRRNRASKLCTGPAALQDRCQWWRSSGIEVDVADVDLAAAPRGWDSRGCAPARRWRRASGRRAWCGRGPPGTPSKRPR